ncbi:protein IscX [Striga asiatica]|uniref:Protein IscX n=1 Tax=Striga asiatica TaxID=4170 RepID=A0A5A7P9P4_STRAF|nr:protein IscX [Striga asiatica]
MRNHINRKGHYTRGEVGRIAEEKGGGEIRVRQEVEGGDKEPIVQVTTTSDDTGAELNHIIWILNLARKEEWKEVIYWTNSRIIAEALNNLRTLVDPENSQFTNVRRESLGMGRGERIIVITHLLHQHPAVVLIINGPQRLGPTKIPRGTTTQRAAPLGQLDVFPYFFHRVTIHAFFKSQAQTQTGPIGSPFDVRAV